MNGRCPRSRFWDLGKHKPLGAEAPSAAPQVLCSQFPQKAHTGKRQTCRQSPRSHGNSKGCVTPDEFKKFCNSVVPLAWLHQRVFTTADKFEVPVEIANFGAADLPDTHCTWSVVNSSGFIVTNGWLGKIMIPLGKNIPLGTITVALAGLPAPAAYKLIVQTDNPPFANDWNFWLYPSNQPPAPSHANFLATSSPAEAEQALAQGKKVLFTPRLADLSWWSPPLARVPIFWNALMGPTWSRILGLWCDTNSPALAEFPTDANCD